jgi:hypothetical protein
MAQMRGCQRAALVKQEGVSEEGVPIKSQRSYKWNNEYDNNEYDNNPMSMIMMSMITILRV